jgi:hypothetical protein
MLAKTLVKSSALIPSPLSRMDNVAKSSSKRRATSVAKASWEFEINSLSACGNDVYVPSLRILMRSIEGSFGVTILFSTLLTPTKYNIGILRQKSGKGALLFGIVQVYYLILRAPTVVDSGRLGVSHAVLLVGFSFLLRSWFAGGEAIRNANREIGVPGVGTAPRPSLTREN